MRTFLAQVSRAAPSTSYGSRRSGRQLLCSASIAVLALSGGLIGSCPASAQEWKGTFTSGWFAAGNWSTGAVPTASDNADINGGPHDPLINTGDAATANIVTAGVTGNGYLNVGNGGTLDSYLGYLGKAPGAFGSVSVFGAGSRWTASQSLYVGQGGSGNLLISNGGKVQDITGYLGYASGSTGEATINNANSVWISTSDLNVGFEGTGSLTLQNGGSALAGTTLIGRLAGSVGKVNIGDTGSSLINSDDLVIGDAGKGELFIAFGGLAQNQQGVIGNLAGSTGKVTLSGAGSKWVNTANLTIGYDGSGALSVLSGALVTSNGFSTLAAFANSSGTAEIVGTDSKWSNNGELTIGLSGAGELNVSGGGTVENTNAQLGYNVKGVATITGANSTWTNSGVLEVGRGGIGTLNISAGGKTTDTNGILGRFATSNGTATVDGAGSTWANSGFLVIGYEGPGALSVLNGALVTSNGFSTLAASANLSGTANIVGSSSKWSNNGEITIGLSGTGELNVSDGGAVENTNAQLGYNVKGVATITGANSTWTNFGVLEVGRGGIGTLNISAGGKTTDTNGIVGQFATSTGTVAVDGAGSTWTNSSDLIIGQSGKGGLTVSNSGSISAVNAAIGNNADGVGAATVQGAGSTWTNTGTLSVGSNGTGTLAILNGGVVSNTAGDIGSFIGGKGTVTVDGAGSKWTNSAGLYVGPNGTGELNILNGGAVSNTLGNIGLAAGSSGAVAVTGTGSTWTNSANLTVGDKGAGALTILAGGKVSNQQAFLGNGAAGQGELTVSGAGSSWTNQGAIAVGGAGVGTLSILDGGKVSNALALIGYLATGTGATTVDGFGSVWNNQALYIGYGGSGVLTVSNGGLASAASGMVIARDAGSNGVVNIGGAAGSSAQAAGMISGDIEFGAGAGILNFNHTDPLYVLASDISGLGTINQLAGVTQLTGLSGGFTGSTAVSGGKLLVNGQLGGTTSVLSGGALGGAGTLTGSVSVAGGGTLLGVEGQTLTLGSLTMASGSRIDATLGAPGGAGLFNVMGDLVLDGEVGVTDAGGFGAGVYRLIDYTGALTDNILDVGVLPNGISSVVQTSVAHQVNLVMSGVVIQGPVPDIQFWNGTTTVANGAVNGGAGTWTAGPLTNWTDANGARNDAWGGKFAVFQNNPGSVQVDASAGVVSTTGLQFIGQGWTVTGDPITLAGDNGATVIRVGDGSAAGASDVATIGSVLDGSSRLVKDDLGTLVLSGANTYSGGTTIKGGTLQIGDGGASGSVLGDVVNDGVLAFSRSDATTIASVISGSGAVQVRSGAVTLTSDNSYSGLTTIRAGATLRLGDGGATGAIGGDVANSGRLEFDRSNAYSFAGALSGNGGLNQIGSGRTTLTGDSSGFTGAATISNGTLAVNGRLGGTLTVQAGGRLQGVGTVGDSMIAGTVAPGNSIGTLHVNGSITFAAGSIYEVEANAAGESDKILASGTATINSGTVQVLAGAGVYDPSTTYTILNAAGGRSGTFSTVTSNLAFLDPSLSYDAQSVYLKLTRNDIDFAAAGATPNQIATGGAVEDLGWGNLAYNAVLNLSKPQASEAFDQLSGEIHASLKGSLIEESRFVREATLKRLLPAEDGRQPAGVWGQGFGAWGRMDGDGNAATLKHSVSGFLMGADAPVLADWRAGLVGGFSRASAHLPARHSSAESQTYHLGAYGGGQWGGLSLRSGLAYSWHNITVGRSVEIPGFASVFSSRYDAHTAQAFAEVGYGFRAGKATLEPFANVAHVRLHTDGFSERGEEAALKAAGDTSAVTLTNLGWRVAVPMTLGKVTARFKGTLGWRHAFDDVDPSRFTLPGGDTFEISGVPLAKNAVIIAPSVDFDLWPDATLGVSYGGQFGSRSTEQTLRANFLVRF